jgi:hypothetical protein
MSSGVEEEQKDMDFQKDCRLIDGQRIEDLRLVFRYLSSLSMYPTAISPELREHIVEIIRRELPSVEPVGE